MEDQAMDQEEWNPMGSPSISTNRPRPMRSARPTEFTSSEGSPLDAAISQLLKEKPDPNDNSYNSEYREHRDICILRRVDTEYRSGDTLVIVEFPQGYVDCKGDPWTPKQFCVNSEKLLATGSRVFERLLSPEMQLRARKRAKAPVSQRYVVDLTPSTEGDELAAQLIELSLPPGVRDWWTSKERLGISPYIVSGHDDHCPFHSTVLVDCKKTTRCLTKRDAPLPNIDLAYIETPESRNIDDYCPIRHRANIIRLILAIEGQDLVLNSAPRVYTLTGVANILDCSRVIADSVYTWFMTEPNTEFIDINTEAAFKVAWTLKLPNVTRAAFRILVAEKTLDTLAVRFPARSPRHTVFGRPRVDLPDDLQTVVQYATHKFADRIQYTFDVMKSDKFYDMVELVEYRKFVAVGEILRITISNIPDSEAKSCRATKLNQLFSAFIILSTKLLEYKDLLLHEAMESDPTIEQRVDFDRDRKCYVPHNNWAEIIVLYREFSDAQHLLKPHFWENLAAYPQQYTEPYYTDRFLSEYVQTYNFRLSEAIAYIHFETGSFNSADLRFHLPEFREELAASLDNMYLKWTKCALETPLTRTNHLVLSLSEDEFVYLPLWADGLNDETGGVFDPLVPDADLGPIGPGPAYHSGATVGTDVSSISETSDRTPSGASTITLTAGRSMAAVPSNVGASTIPDVSDRESVGGNDAMSIDSVVTAASTATLDDDIEFLEYEESDTTDDEAWSHVEGP
ncbi:uncharacterized protein F4822DRAFT_386990 [Hypoxylon trugodes]|uniref:uncharacterized protein n=1 Tax=Hypoxylon trugodes TaxID=326681 RepID=UPI00218E69D0|nr:uncharacterized protein F4822DRAFT_386990 [Hypoxylon trugodes]KAI1394076.1 hypothetical protein F4822DRAFT_386990 [Hypoxylon trugodes]